MTGTRVQNINLTDIYIDSSNFTEKKNVTLDLKSRVKSKILK